MTSDKMTAEQKEINGPWERKNRKKERFKKKEVQINRNIDHQNFKISKKNIKIVVYSCF